MDTHKQDLAQQFIGTFATLKRIISRLSSTSHEEKMATALQFQALIYLNDHAETTVGELAQELGMSSSAIAQLTDRLTNAGRIMRKSDRNDRRITHISLTEEGKRELTQMKAKYVEKMTFLLSHISDNDLAELIRIQTKLINTLEGKKSL